MVVFKLLIADVTEDAIDSWTRGVIISERTGAILLLNVSSFSVIFILSGKVLGGNFILSLAVNLLISGCELCFLIGLSARGEPLSFLSSIY